MILIFFLQKPPDFLPFTQKFQSFTKKLHIITLYLYLQKSSELLVFILKISICYFNREKF